MYWCTYKSTAMPIFGCRNIKITAAIVLPNKDIINAVLLYSNEINHNHEITYQD